jgi:hypothetical protein
MMVGMAAVIIRASKAPRKSASKAAQMIQFLRVTILSDTFIVVYFIKFGHKLLQYLKKNYSVLFCESK